MFIAEMVNDEESEPCGCILCRLVALIEEGRFALATASDDEDEEKLAALEAALDEAVDALEDLLGRSRDDDIADYSVGDLVGVIRISQREPAPTRH